MTNREIKFRALTKNPADLEEKWEWEYFEAIQDMFIDGEWYFNKENIKLKTISQFTGLKDKNGIEIYEGDILKCNSEVSFVVWGLDGWRFNSYMGRNNLDLYTYVNKTTGKEVAEVIGNIYENKELIK